MQNHKNIQSENSLNLEQFELAVNELFSFANKVNKNDFYLQIAKKICEILPVNAVFIGLFQKNTTGKIETLSAYHNSQKLSNFSYSIAQTPCEQVIKQGDFCVDENVQFKFPDSELSKMVNGSGYVGCQLTNDKGDAIGLITVMSSTPIKDIQFIKSVVKVCAFRVSAQIEQLELNKNFAQEVLINKAQVDSVPALMFTLDKQGNFVRWNSYFNSKFGFNHQNMEQKNVYKAVHKADQSRLELEIKNVFEHGSSTMYLNGLTRDGDIVPLLATAQKANYDGEDVVVGVALDMTEQQNVERNLLRSQGRLARKNSQLNLINDLVEKLYSSHNVYSIAHQVVKAFKNIYDGALIYFQIVDETKKNVQTIASSGSSDKTLSARRTFPIDESGSPTGLAMASRNLEVFRSMQTDERFAPSIKSLTQHEGIKCGIVIPLIYSNQLLGSITVAFRFDSDFDEEELEFYRTIGTSVSLALNNAHQFETLENLATTDALTDLPNRNALNQDCSRLLENNKNTDQLLGLILVDLDRFKEINDTLDHQIGDKLLQCIGPRLSQALKAESISLYRLGGDEFCVLVEDIDSIEDAEAVAALINLAIAKPFNVDGLNLEISTSIGVVTCQGANRSANEMLRCAELAMYHAKSVGGGIQKYSKVLDADTSQRFVIMSEMAEAIRKDNLILHYQPKLDLTTKQIVGCEALVRWQHKDYGLISPIKFIPLIELTQLIHPLTNWVMKTAMAQLDKWKKQGISVEIAINLSTRNLIDENFIQQVDDLMKEHAIKPKELEFEVTETALMGNLEASKKQLFRLNKRGIKCYLDDYGTGYSSLSYLKNLPIDGLKIDRSFISTLAQDPRDRTIAHSTINLAHSLGLKVIAEGVEDKLTLHELARQGCDYVQGFYISEPLDAESFAKLYWEHS